MGLLSRAARAGARRVVTLADMDKSLLNAASRRGIESNVDPRLIMGAGAAGMAPAGAATAYGLDAISPYEQAAQNDQRLERRSRVMNEALRLRMMGYGSRDVADPDLQSALAQLEWQGQQPNPMVDMLAPGGQTQGLPQDAYAGRPGFYPRDSGR